MESGSEGIGKFSSCFYVHYELYNKSHLQNTMAMGYFAFTTLATVGFGDYAPRSDPERVVGAFLLLMGVLIFSYVMGIFQAVLAQIN